MKARISPKNGLTKKQLYLVEEYATEICKKRMYGMMRRIFKSFAYSLNLYYWFGKYRTMVVLDKAKEIMDEYPENEIFCEQLDRVVIDEIGIDFVREKTDKDGKAVFTDDDTEIHASKKHT